MFGGIGDAIFGPTTIYLNQHLVSSNIWQHRYAALSAIASICEGCVDLFNEQLSGITR
jgi:hypothetical protein